MVDISSEIKGVQFRNPVLLAGGPGVKGETLKKVGLAGAGGVVTKTFRLKGTKQIYPRIFKIGKNNLVNVEGPSEEDAQSWLKEISIAKEAGVPVVASIIGSPEPPFQEIIELAKLCQKSGADMMEYVLFHAVSKKSDYRKVGIDTTQDPEVIFDITRAIRTHVDIPISLKLPPSTLDIVAMAKAAEQAGADALTAINTLPNCLAGIDIETGKPIHDALGNYSGTGIKPLGLGSVARIAKAVKIPVVGVGGILSWRDMVEYIMVGAHHVEICTAFFIKGIDIFKEMVSGLSDYMENKGYKSLSELQGIALQHIKTMGEAERVPAYATVDEDICTGCKMCMQSCVYGAISSYEDTIKIDNEKCGGCGMCLAVCPVNAITLVQV